MYVDIGLPVFVPAPVMLDSHIHVISGHHAVSLKILI